MRRVARLALAATFVLVLSGGAAVSYAKMAADRFPGPSWRVRDWRWYPPRFETALTDHLAGREALVGWHARFKLHTLRTSPTPRVWLGSDGWLFLNHWAELRSVDLPVHLGFAVEQWGSVMRARRDWCEARGIRLLVVVVPDKQSVYPERLPAVARDRAEVAVLDRVLERWRAEPAVPVVDLRAGLRAAKRYGSVYFRNDTHWTPLGSYVGGVHVLDDLTDVLPGPALPPWTAMAHVVESCSIGDIWRMAGMQRSPPDEQVSVAVRPNVRARRTGEVVRVPDVDRLKHLHPAVWEGGAGPRVVLFHDSFAGIGFQSLIADRSERLVAVGTYQFMKEVVLREGPQVVICELAERMLTNFPPPPR